MCPQGRQPETTPALRLDGLSLLVVEDDEDIRAMIAAVLRSAGAAVVEAGSAQAAGQHLAGSVIDGLVLDWNLLDAAGEDFLARLETDHRLVWNRCLVVTGELVRSHEEHAAARMGRPVLAKPFRPRQLLEALAPLFSLDQG